MVVAIKKDDKISVGITVCDSLVDMTEKDLSLMENIPFWKVKGTKDCYVFAEDLTYGVDLLRYNDHIFKNITDGNSIIVDVVPQIKEILTENNKKSVKKLFDVFETVYLQGDRDTVNTAVAVNESIALIIVSGFFQPQTPRKSPVKVTDESALS